MDAARSSGGDPPELQRTEPSDGAPTPIDEMATFSARLGSLSLTTNSSDVGVSEGDVSTTPLQTPWRVHKSRSSGKEYYFNKDTGESVYEPPPDYLAFQQRAQAEDATRRTTQRSAAAMQSKPVLSSLAGEEGPCAEKHDASNSAGAAHTGHADFGAVAADSRIVAAKAVAPIVQIDLTDEMQHPYRAAGCVLLRLRAGSKPDVLVVRNRWSREFSKLLHRLQEPETTAATVQPLIRKLADAELLLLSGATSFWQVAHHRVVAVAEDAVHVTRITAHDAATEAGWPDRRGRLDVPHVWLKGRNNMNGNIADSNFVRLSIAEKAGDVLTVRLNTDECPPSPPNESLPKGDFEPGIDADMQAAALRELEEEGAVPTTDVTVLDAPRMIRNVEWTVCRIKPESKLHNLSRWFTGIQNPESIVARWVPWDTAEAASWSSRPLIDHVNGVLQRGGFGRQDHSRSGGDGARRDSGWTRPSQSADRGAWRARSTQSTDAQRPAGSRGVAAHIHKEQCRNAAKGKPCARQPCPFSHAEHPAV